jgi:hypothetical protein
LHDFLSSGRKDLPARSIISNGVTELSRVILSKHGTGPRCLPRTLSKIKERSQHDFIVFSTDDMLSFGGFERISMVTVLFTILRAAAA